MEFLSFGLYLSGMVRIVLILALLVTVSLKHFERTPVFAPATAPAISELALAAGVSTTIVRASQCDDKDAGAFNQQRSHKSDCKAVIAMAAINSILAPDAPIVIQEPPGNSPARLVDLPPPIS